MLVQAKKVLKTARTAKVSQTTQGGSTANIPLPHIQQPSTILHSSFFFSPFTIIYSLLAFACCAIRIREVIISMAT